MVLDGAFATSAGLINSLIGQTGFGAGFAAKKKAPNLVSPGASLFIASRRRAQGGAKCAPIVAIPMQAIS